MRLFFKSMSRRQAFNWKRATYFGFYAYLLITAINYFSYLATGQNLFTPAVIFWSGLLVAFGSEWVLNVTDKKKNKKETS